MSRGDFYGRLHVVANPEAAQLWRARHDEPAPAPQFGLRADYVLSDDDDKARVRARELWADMARALTWRELIVLRLRYEHDLAYWEVGSTLGVSHERARQIERQALRRIRASRVAEAWA